MVHEQLDLVLQRQLAVLEPGELELVALSLPRQRGDFLVQPPVLGLQRVELCAGSSSFIALGLQPSRAASSNCRDELATSRRGQRTFGCETKVGNS